jgi:hypothetical protein
MKAPEESLTVPVTEAEYSCARAGATIKKNRSRNKQVEIKASGVAGVGLGLTSVLVVPGLAEGFIRILLE